MYEEIFRVPLPTPTFLTCCPWWMIRSKMITEVAGYAFESGNGNLTAFFVGGSIPCATRDAIRMYDQGYQKGLRERNARASR